MAKYQAYTKDNKCIFCQIANRKFKTPGIFWEDENFMAFLSIYPNTKGFTVVIPKQHFDSDVLAMPNDILTKFVLAAKKVAQILIEYFDDVGRVGLIMEGTGINHAHIKLFPMHGTGYMKQGKWKQIHSRNNKYFTEYEGYISSNDGPRADDTEIKRLANDLRKVAEKY